LEEFSVTVQTRIPGIIDTIGAGYQAVNRRLWLLSVPFLVSLYLWYGAPVRITPFLEIVNVWLTDLFVRMGAGGVGAAELLFSLQYHDVRNSLALNGLLPILSPVVAQLSVPTRLLEAPPAVLGAVVLFNAGGLFLGILFRAGLAGALLGMPLRLRADLKLALLTAGKLCLSVAVVLATIMLLTLPFLVLSAVLMVVVPAAAGLIGFLWYMVAIWVYLYTGFTLEALLISKVGPLQAISQSIVVVRRNLWSAMALLVLAALISAGLHIVWLQLVGNPAGLLLAIIGKGYIGGGLAAARLEFYRSRLGHWQAQPLETGRGATTDTSSGKTK
jgi:hypothetical protein